MSIRQTPYRGQGVYTSSFIELLLGAVIGRLVRRLEAYAEFLSFCLDSPDGALKLQTDDSRRGVPVRQLHERPLLLRRPVLTGVLVIFSHKRW